MTLYAHKIRPIYLEKLQNMYIDLVVNIDSTGHPTSQSQVHNLHFFDICDIGRPHQVGTRFVYQKTFSQEILAEIPKFRFLAKTCQQVTARVYNMKVSGDLASTYTWYSENGKSNIWILSDELSSSIESIGKDEHPTYVTFYRKAGPAISIRTLYNKENS